ncbi:hypothetical protein OSTOST_16026 [Ostertagia ostertagi]
MMSGKFTTESGKQKIIEYIRKYAVTFHAGRYSSTIYFSVDVSTVYIKRPVDVTFTLPDSKRAHKLDTPRTHFEEFLRTIYPYGREK